MSGRLPRSLGLAALVALTAYAEAAALAQTPPAPAAPQDTPPAPAPAESAAPAPAPPPGGSVASVPPAGSASPPKDTAAKDSAVTGYGYGSRRGPPPPAPSGYRSPHYGRLAHHANEAVATFPGFEMLADGGSRLFVQLSRQVEVDEQKGQVRTVAAPKSTSARKGKRARAAAATAVTTLTFVMKGTEVVQRNNENALVTVHFNTPVVRARLSPAGGDLRFIVDLRADVTPTMKVVPAKDNGAMLQIDFPPGSYLPAGADAAEDSADQPAPSAPSGVSDSMGSN